VVPFVSASLNDTLEGKIIISPRRQIATFVQYISILKFITEMDREEISTQNCGRDLRTCQ
jgi:hypothetical protein